MEQNKQDALMKKESAALMKWPERFQKIVAPVADIFETESAFVIRLDVPGVRKDAFRITVESNHLSISAVIDGGQSANMDLSFSEIGEKCYVREFNLGEGIDQNLLSAEYDDGVLTILLPKTEAAKKKHIHIQ